MEVQEFLHCCLSHLFIMYHKATMQSILSCPDKETKPNLGI